MLHICTGLDYRLADGRDACLHHQVNTPRIQMAICLGLFPCRWGLCARGSITDYRDSSRLLKRRPGLLKHCKTRWTRRRRLLKHRKTRWKRRPRLLKHRKKAWKRRPRLLKHRKTRWKRRPRLLKHRKTRWKRRPKLLKHRKTHS